MTQKMVVTTVDPILLEFPSLNTSIWEQVILPSSITATWNFHSKLKPKKNRPTQSFFEHVFFEHTNPSWQCCFTLLEVPQRLSYEMKVFWRFQVVTIVPKWPFFFLPFGYQQGEGEGFYHHNLSNSKPFKLHQVAFSLTPRYKYLIVNRPLGDEVFRPKREVSSEKPMRKHRWKFESKILRLRLRGCYQKAVGEPMHTTCTNMHIKQYKYSIYRYIWNCMSLPLSKLHFQPGRD